MAKFLPELDQALQPPAPNAGAEWGEHDAGLGVLAKYSGSLAVPHVDINAEKLKSVPSPWARVLLFEQALFQDRHPVHAQVRAEWRGLLAAIGLAKHIGLTFQARPVDIGSGKGVIRSLRSMLPLDDNVALWEQIVLLYFDGQLLGGTSPRTLVFTGIRPIKTGRIPFQESGRLVDPTEYYARTGDSGTLGLLEEWLDATKQELAENRVELDKLLGFVPSPTGAQRLARREPLLRNLQEWLDDTRAAAERAGRRNVRVLSKLVPTPIATAFASTHPATDVFQHVRHAEAAEDVAGVSPLSIEAIGGVADPGESGILLKAGQPYTGNLVLPRGNARAVRNGRFVLPTTATSLGATLPDLSTFFSRRLIAIAEPPGDAVRLLQAGDAYYLLPFKPEILTAIDPDVLAAWITADGDLATGIRVTLDVPLNTGLVLRYERQYFAADVLDADQVPCPLLTIWPNFESPSWEHYFYVQRHPTRATNPLWLSPVGAADSGLSYREDSEGVRWGKLAQMPHAWVGSFGSDKGILLLDDLTNPPKTDEAWDVSIDFGSTHTRVFKRSIGVGGRQQSEEVKLTPRARPLLGVDRRLEDNFFPGGVLAAAPQSELASLVWLPLERTPERQDRADWLPVDGIMYWGSVHTRESTRGLRGNLKWHSDDAHERSAFHSYIAQLFLATAAEAAARGGKIRSLVTAFPSVFPRNLRHRHDQEWRELRRFGVNVETPRSESDAVAAYLVGQRSASTTSLLAVDIGGSTSDLTVWASGKRANGDSIRFAGDILSRLMMVDAEAREAMTKALRRPPFNIPSIRWDDQDAVRNGLILNSILRTVSRGADYRVRPDLLAQNLYDAPGSAGERVLAHLGYLFATVSFVLGLLVKRHGLSADRYDVRFAGRGSEFLHWLEALGTGLSRELPKTFFLAAVGKSKDEVEVAITPPGDYVKQEVGRGLLLESVSDSPNDDERNTFVGETGFQLIDGPVTWDASLTFATLQTIPQPTPPTDLAKLTNLQLFVRTILDAPAAQAMARGLGVRSSILNKELRDQIHTRLFGPASAWSAVQEKAGNREGQMLLEPFFVTEAKVLLEHATGNKNLFLPW
jgi:hypothetical protein